MKKKLILCLSCFFLVINFVKGQQRFGNDNYAVQCGAAAAQKSFLKNNPAFNSLDKQIEEQLAFYNRNAHKPLDPQSVVTLPVVVHIIHNNGPENISDAQVLAGIQHLNEAFANVGYYDPSSGVNTNIQFCMAQRDPDNNPTNGITRNISSYTNMSGPDYYSDDINVKNINRWNPLHYINIWLVNDIPSNVAGYAYLPSAHGSNVDGIIEEAAYFGSSYANDVVMIHEMGHYLGLYHSFEQGCSNADCVTNGDKVCDTPPDNSTAYTSCNVQVNSCSTDMLSGFSTDQNDLTEDYMDYGNWNCMSIFTAGQSARMNWFITNVRNSLVNAKSCLPPCTASVTANFNSSATNIIVGTAVSFTNTSLNGVTYKWYIDEVFQSASLNFSTSFASPGQYQVKLVVEGNNPASCESSTKTVLIVVTCPVQADFTSSAIEVPIGQTINFTNTTTGSPSFTNWLINNVQLSNTIDFFNQFNTPGSYTITLSTGTSICTSVRNMIINVIEPCAERVYFEKAITTAAFNFIPYHTIVTKDSGIVIAGATAGIVPTTNEYATIWKLSKNGNLLWTKQYKSVYGTGFEKIIQSYDGSFIALGEIQLIPMQQAQVLVAKINANGSIIWQKVYSNGVTDYLHAFNYSLIETPAHDIVLGVSLQSNTVFADNVLIKLDPSGNILWSKKLRPDASVYITDMAIKNDKLYLGLSGYYLTQYSGGFAKVNLSDGTINFAKKYSITAPVATDILRVKNVLFINDELRLYGTVTGNNGSADTGSHLIMHMDTIGTMQYAKRIRLTDPALSLPGNSFISMNGVILRNGEYVFVESEVYGQQNFIHHTDLTYSNFTTKKLPAEIFQAYTVAERGNNNIIITSTGGNGSSNKMHISSSDYSGEVSLSCPLTQSASYNQGTTILNADFPELVLQDAPFAIVPNTVLYDSTIQMGMENVCGINNSSSCYSIKINSPDTLCISEDSVLISCHRNEGCTERINWSVSLPGQQSFVQVNDTTIKILFAAFGNYSVVVSLGSCTLVNDTANIFVSNRADYLSLGADRNLCKSSTIKLSAGVGYKSYKWYDGSTDSTNTIYHPGTYFVMVEDYCHNTKTDTIKIMQAPVVPFELGPDTVRCNNDIVTLTAPAGFANYTWAPNYNINITSGQAIQVWPAQDTVYTVTALLNSGCLVLDSIRVSVSQSPPIHLGNDTVYCRNVSIQLVASPGFDSYLWNTNDATSMINVNTSGVYSIAATWNNGCISKDTIQLAIGYPKNFILPSIDICTGGQNTIRPLSVYNTYLWSTGSANDSLLITQPGNYWLQVSDTFGCVGKQDFIAIEKDCIKAIYFPAAFSPNADNINDVFRPKVYGEPEYFKLQLYNRFGQRIYETSNWNTGWDGKYKGAKQNIGAYMWIAVYKLKNVAEETQKGSVLLLQ